MGLEEAGYEEQVAVRNESLFAVADFYSSNLRRLGHEAWDIHANNEPMQRAWAREHGVPLSPATAELRRQRCRTSEVLGRFARGLLTRRLRRLVRGRLGWRYGPGRWYYEALAAQIRHYRPDVLLNQAMDGIRSDFQQELKPHVRLLVGQIAAPLPCDDSFRPYDVVLSSLPNYVEHFRRLGMQSELHRLGFEPRVLHQLGDAEPTIDLSFVGSLSAAHQERVLLLEWLATAGVPLRIWGMGIDGLAPASPLRQCYSGTAWGIGMYQVLARSLVTVNRHIEIAESYANNLRLFEATGVGTLLVTDWKQNLHELFEPGRDVVAYKNAAECVDLVRYYLEHENERRAIARAGQQRTLRDHTYAQRMTELVALISRYL